MKKTIGLAAAIALAFSAPPALAAKFYKWTDANGVTHYSADPPPADAKAKASEVRVRSPRAADAEEPVAAEATGAASPATAAAPGTPAKPAEAAKAKGEAGDKEKDKKPAANDRYSEKCKQLRNNLQAMEEHSRVKEADDKGNVRVLTDEEKNERLDATQRQIKAFCE